MTPGQAKQSNPTEVILNDGPATVYPVRDEAPISGSNSRCQRCDINLNPACTATPCTHHPTVVWKIGTPEIVTAWVTERLQRERPQDP